jgi:hypothetical protein
MPDVADVVPPAIDQTGNTVIWWVNTIADLAAVKAATELGAATSFRVTHSFTPDGFPFDSTQNKNTDERLALPEVLESLGTTQYTFGDGLIYVDSAVASAAAVVLKPVAPATSKSGYFVVRVGVSNGTLAAASQKGFVIPVTLGQQRRGPVDGQGKFRWRQQVTITGPVVETTFAA